MLYVEDRRGTYCFILDCVSLLPTSGSVRVNLSNDLVVNCLAQVHKCSCHEKLQRTGREKQTLRRSTTTVDGSVLRCAQYKTTKAIRHPHSSSLFIAIIIISQEKEKDMFILVRLLESSASHGVS